jgi:hypothetical protein
LTARGRIGFRLKQATIAEIIAAYGAGVGGEQVAAEHEVSRWTVLKLVRERGLVQRRFVTPRCLHQD